MSSKTSAVHASSMSKTPICILIESHEDQVVKHAGAAAEQVANLRLAAMGLVTAACSWEDFRLTRAPFPEPGSQPEPPRYTTTGLLMRSSWQAFLVPCNSRRCLRLGLSITGEAA